MIAAGLLLGAGLGGFVDGIALHQILQWHNMLSSVRPPTDLVSMKFNMLWDGFFHALMWLMTVTGVGMLFRVGARGDTPWSGRTLAGAMLAGWGIFDVVEGAIDHQLLGLHHVRPGAHEASWDVGFLALGVALALFGWWLVSAGRGDVAPPDALAPPLLPLEH